MFNMANEERIIKLKLLLKELFQFENNDLDFGIYRIVNIKKKEISEFIDKELFDIIKEKIKTVEEDTDLKKTIEILKKEIETTFGCDIEGAKKGYAETPKVKEYLEKTLELKKADKENDIEEEIYDDIISFFSRYYDKGDFISKRRYSKDRKYSIPYNGEEVYLYWANNDQYYIKTTENFYNYSFKPKEIKVNFEVASDEVDVEKNNVKDTDKKFFIFHNAEYKNDKKELTVQFGYRSLTDVEEKEIS
jgi:adenine-specific DNA-methyltransferase